MLDASRRSECLAAVARHPWVRRHSPASVKSQSSSAVTSCPKRDPRPCWRRATPFHRRDDRDAGDPVSSSVCEAGNVQDSDSGRAAAINLRKYMPHWRLCCWTIPRSVAVRKPRRCGGRATTAPATAQPVERFSVRPRGSVAQSTGRRRFVRQPQERETQRTCGSGSTRMVAASHPNGVWTSAARRETFRLGCFHRLR